MSTHFAAWPPMVIEWTADAVTLFELVTWAISPSTVLGTFVRTVLAQAGSTAAGFVKTSISCHVPSAAPSFVSLA